MAYTSLATKVYKDPLTVVWANSIKENFDEMKRYMCIQAWANFDSIGGLTIHNSYNVDSITESLTGKYNVVWATGTFSNTEYVVGGACKFYHDQNWMPFISLWNSGSAYSVTAAHISVGYNSTFLPGQGISFMAMGNV